MSWRRSGCARSRNRRCWCRYRRDTVPGHRNLLRVSGAHRCLSGCYSTLMKYTKPTAFTFNGTRYEVTSRKSMLVRLCEIVHNEQGSRFEEVLNLKRTKTGKLSDFLRTRKQGTMKIKRTDIFVNTNKSADQIIQTLGIQVGSMRCRFHPMAQLSPREENTR